MRPAAAPRDRIANVFGGWAGELTIHAHPLEVWGGERSESYAGGMSRKHEAAAQSVSQHPNAA